jgi:hypothetical protein
LAFDVIELDPGKPFSAARARNEGIAWLLQQDPSLAYVQFLDGDCVMDGKWLETGRAYLNAHATCAVVCGRCREQHPTRSIYNKLCDMEWNTPVGPAKYCGGNALMRVKAFKAVHGFNQTLVAGEEPELCVRLRAAWWRIMRLDAEMVQHDARIYTFGVWWRRAVRTGYAFALGASLHGAPPERHWVREVRSNWFWGTVFPLLMLAFLWPSGGWSVLMFGGYGVLAARIYRHRRRRFGDGRGGSLLYAVACVVGKFAHVVGQVRFWKDQLRERAPVSSNYRAAGEVS